MKIYSVHSLVTLSSTVMLGVLAAAPAARAADRELLDALLENGAITDEQYERLAEPADSRADTGPVVEVGSGGLEVRSSDGAYAVNLGGRLHADFTRHSGTAGLDPQPSDGTNVRRARVTLDGTFARDWDWMAETDFAGNDVRITDYWLRYTGFEGVDLTVGHQKQPYSLAVEMSSNDIPFTERGIDTVLVIPFINRAIGVRADAHGERWFFAGGVYGESIDTPGPGDEGWGVAARYVLAPLVEDRRVLHLGLRGAYRETAKVREDLRIRDETTNSSDLSILDTGLIADVEDATLYGPEFAWVQGPFSVGGEYNVTELGRMAAPDLEFSSWHVAATWSLTGESRAAAYRIGSGEFKRLTPARPFDRQTGGFGAWELAARFAELDLNDGTFVGGREEAFSAALNWYVNRNVRFMLNWTHVVDTDGATPLAAAAESLDVYTLRTQFTF